MLYSLGDHTFKLKLGYLKDDDIDEGIEDTKDIALATYSYYNSYYDSLTEFTVGKYYNQDTGFDFQIKRYFGETLVRFFYQKADDQYIGIGVEIPLTPRYVPNTKYGQIKGQKLFSHQLRTVVRSDDSQNFVKPGGLINPKLEFDIESRFLNRNRFTESYIKKHILRLRNAYLTYVKE